MRDRDAKFTAAFDTVFTTAGIDVLRTQPAPQATSAMITDRCRSVIRGLRP